MTSPMLAALNRRTVLGGAAGAGLIAALAPTSSASAAIAPASQYGSRSAGLLMWSRPNIAGAGSRDAIVLLPYEYGLIPQIKAANPSARVLSYRNLMAVSTAARGATQPSVVRYEEVRDTWAWQLHDASGNAVRWTDFGGYLQPVDLGDPALIARSKSQLVTENKDLGFDGIYLDDVLSRWEHTSTGMPTDYYRGGLVANQTAWLDAVVPAFRSTGQVVVANVQSDTSSTWRDPLTTFGSRVDAVALEHYIKWGDYSSSAWPVFTGSMWDLRRQQIAHIESLGKAVLPISWADRTDTAVQAYHRASFLIQSSNPYSTSSFVPGDHSTTDLPVATADLGAPVADVTNRLAGVYARQFVGGFAVVNTSGSGVTASPSQLGVGSSTSSFWLPAGRARLQKWNGTVYA